MTDLIVHYARPENVLEWAVPLLRATEGSAGLDIACPKDLVLPAGEFTAVHTGISVAIPAGYAGFVYERSSLHTRGLRLANGVGVIDSDYRGELIVKLLNFGDQDYALARGERVAQLVIQPVAVPQIREVDGAVFAELGTARGAGGFGSTGLAA